MERIGRVLGHVEGGARRDRVAVIIGAGDGIGSAVAHRLARDGFVVCVGRRHIEPLLVLCAAIKEEGGRAVPFKIDAREEKQVESACPIDINMLTIDQVEDAFGQIERDIGDITFVLYNIGANIKLGVLETSSRQYRKVWELACFGGFLVGREAAQLMLSRGRNATGTIAFSGATASIRGGAGFSAFSSAKFGLRALAQSMARELSPRNIHVVHVVIDGAVDTPFIRNMFPDINPDSLVQPANVADVYLFLHQQPRSAWTHELDLRTNIETPW